MKKGLAQTAVRLADADVGLDPEDCIVPEEPIEETPPEEDCEETPPIEEEPAAPIDCFEDLEVDLIDWRPTELGAGNNELGHGVTTKAIVANAVQATTTL